MSSSLERNWGLSYQDVLQPVRLVDGRVPVGLVNGGIQHVLHLPQRLSYHMDVGDLQEVHLHVGVETLTFKAPVFSLEVVVATVEGAGFGDTLRHCLPDTDCSERWDGREGQKRGMDGRDAAAPCW